VKSTGNILALDLAAKFGYAVVDHAGFYCTSGHRILTSTDRGRRLHQLALSLNDLIDEFGAEFIAIERPIHSGPRTSLNTARALYGYTGVAEMVAHVREIGFVEIPRADALKRALGKGRAEKAECVAWCQQFKAGLSSEDEADAILVAMAAAEYRREGQSSSQSDEPPLLLKASRAASGATRPAARTTRGRRATETKLPVFPA
jgi:Holliday junction resolvasome RuvABC endonuclease subunit